MPLVHIMLQLEAGGIEPPSENTLYGPSTCVGFLLSHPTDAENLASCQADPN